MLLPPPSSTRTDTPCPDSTLVRSRYADHATNQGGGTGAGTAATRAIDRRIQRRWGLRLEGGERMDGFGEADALLGAAETRSEEHTSELQSLMRISYAVFCLKKI